MNGKFLILVVDRYDHYNRHFVWSDTLERAKKIAQTYEKDNKYSTEIYTNCESVE
jgi:hypothetical protein